MPLRNKCIQACRIGCIYFITLTVISSLIFCILTKIQQLETDMKHIFKELEELAGNSFHSSAEQKPFIKTDGIRPQTLSTDAELEGIIRKHTQVLEAEWIETKDLVDKLLAQCEKKVSHCDSKQSDIARTDFASDSLGGAIVTVEDIPYVKNNFLMILLGLAVIQNEPRNVLNPSMKPGDCYAFKGSNSTIIIKLMTKIFIDSVTVEHIDETISPSGNLKSAPKEFSIYGLQDLSDTAPFYFGSFTYNIYIGNPSQVFIFTRQSKMSYRLVQFKFISNNGHSNFTCVYRLSVHGEMDNNNST